VRLLRVAAGAGIAAFGLVVLWAIGLAPVPEGVTRRLSAFEAVFPGRWTGAEVERIACPPLSGLRLYVVCTDGCDGIWKVIGVRGFRTLALVNLNRMPPEPTEEVRRRFNREIAKEALRRAHSVMQSDPKGPVYLTFPRETLTEIWSEGQIRSYPEERFGPVAARSNSRSSITKRCPPVSLRPSVISSIFRGIEP